MLLWVGRLQNVKSELLVRAENTITTPILPPSQALQTFLLSDYWFLLALISVISSHFLKRRSRFSFLIKKERQETLTGFPSTCAHLSHWLPIVGSGAAWRRKPVDSTAAFSSNWNTPSGRERTGSGDSGCKQVSTVWKPCNEMHEAFYQCHPV